MLTMIAAVVFSLALLGRRRRGQRGDRWILAGLTPLRDRRHQFFRGQQ